MKRIFVILTTLLLVSSCTETKETPKVTHDDKKEIISISERDMNEIVELYKSLRGAFGAGNEATKAHVYANLSEIANDSEKDTFVRRHACKTLLNFKNYMSDTEVSTYVWTIDTRVRYLASLSDEDYFLVLKDEAEKLTSKAK